MKHALSLTALLLAAPLSAQAPRITPAGDPTVLADTIYALGVALADAGDEDALILLDDGVVVVESDGTGSTTYRTIAQVLTRDAVDGWAELSFGYDAVDEEFTLNWVRVVETDGRVVSDEPLLHQVMDAPVADVSPIYTDRKQVRLSLAGLEPGRIVDYSYTITTEKPRRPGEFTASWLISMGQGVRRSRYVVDVPADMDLTLESAPNTMDPVIEVQGGRKTYQWNASDLAPIEPEYFQVMWERPEYQSVQWATPSSWADIGAWYADLARDRYELSADVLAQAEAVVGAREGNALLQELYRWIAQDFRYVSISLGLGGYQPRLPAEVLASRSGDCKDKATLFIALARHYGFEAYPVLLNSGGAEEELPSVGQFNHAIAAVRHEGEWIYLDLTASIVPFGEIPGGYQGEFGIIVFDDGSVEEITFPLDPPEANGVYVTVEGTLGVDGSFDGTFTSRSTGLVAHEARASLAREFTADELEDAAQGLAAVVEGGRGSNLRIFHGMDLEAEALLSVDISSARATRQNVGGGQIFILPIDSHGNPELVAALEAEPPRISPIRIDEVSGPVTLHSELRLTLPEGWTAELPEDVVAHSRFGVYEARFDQEGTLVTVSRHLTGATGEAPKEAYGELVDWLRAIATDEALFLLLQPAA
jgi:hypothetical protein